MANNVGDLPNALTRAEDLEKRLEGGAPAVFLDYDGTLTPIVDRPEDAVISDSMQRAVRELAERCPVCVVSGRDRKVVQDLMGLDNLIVAGSHGFDIWSPDEGKIDGASVEPKAASVAIHYRLVSEEEQHRVKEIVDRILEEHPDDLKMTPGKMVYEIQPKIDWDKGKAVVYLLETLELDRDDVVPIYVGDDVTDEDAFGAISDVGIGVFVGGADDPDSAGRTTAADYVLGDVQEVERFLNGLAR
jgi:trehalose 6-phosphate phosphatase